MKRLLELFFRRDSEYEKRLHEKSKEIGQQSNLSLTGRIKAFHIAREEIQSEVEQNRPQLANVIIDGHGEFTPRFEPLSHRIACFTQEIEFKNQKVDLIFYPGLKDRPSQKKQERLMKQFNDFANSLDSALVDLPPKLRKLCDEYGLETVNEQTDAELIKNIRWKNIKLESSNWIECYTENPAITKNFDIVMRFKRPVFQRLSKLKHVHFDG